MPGTIKYLIIYNELFCSHVILSFKLKSNLSSVSQTFLFFLSLKSSSQLNLSTFQKTIEK